ncbi:hypothetical protein [Silvanigrella aquatica]|nr:hypothetical protein [Silvanigrella aquatica]
MAYLIFFSVARYAPQFGQSMLASSSLPFVVIVASDLHSKHL